MILIPRDKANHAIYGAVIFAVTYVAMQLSDIVAYRSEDVALVASLLAAVGKEAADWYANKKAGAQVHGVELNDAVATFLGGMLLYGVLYV